MRNKTSTFPQHARFPNNTSTLLQHVPLPLARPTVCLRQPQLELVVSSRYRRRRRRRRRP